MTSFLHPQAFLLLLLLPLWGVLRFAFRRRGIPVTRIPETGEKSWRIRTRFLPDVLAQAALVLLIIALARPREGFTSSREITEGVAIELVVDRSSSMQAPVAGALTSRFDTVKKLFARFVEGRPDDMIGIVTFARFPDTWCPLTLTRDIMPTYLELLEPVERGGPEDATAIGDGILLAAARLRRAEEEARKAEEAGTDLYRIRSKVIILFTDGNNNAGDATPLEAADKAAEWGVKIYTVGFYGGLGQGSDPEILKAVAESTGGTFFPATSAGSVEEIFAAIDRLEKGPAPLQEFTEYRERFVPFLAAGLVTALVSWLLSLFVYRRIL